WPQLPRSHLAPVLPVALEIDPPRAPQPFLFQPAGQIRRQRPAARLMSGLYYREPDLPQPGRREAQRRLRPRTAIHGPSRQIRAETCRAQPRGPIPQPAGLAPNLLCNTRQITPRTPRTYPEVPGAMRFRELM